MQQAALRVAVTGNIGSGKSTLARMFEEFGACRVDADAVSRRVVTESTALQQQLAAAFGAELLDQEWHLDRRGLARRALADAAGRQLLEDLIRPHLQPVLEAELASTELASAGLARPIIVLDAPHVFEWKIEDWFDRIFVVSADMGVADARVAASRDLSLEEVRERRAAQLSDGERRGSFEVVDNNGSLDDLRSMAERIWQDLADAPGAG